MECRLLYKCSPKTKGNIQEATKGIIPLNSLPLTIYATFCFRTVLVQQSALHVFYSSMPYTYRSDFTSFESLKNYLSNDVCMTYSYCCTTRMLAARIAETAGVKVWLIFCAYLYFECLTCIAASDLVKVFAPYNLTASHISQTK